MGLFGGSKNSISEDERYVVLGLAKDEDWTLYEFVTKLKIPADRVRETVVDSVSKGMLEVLVIRPDRNRITLNASQAAVAVGRDASWEQSVPGKDKILLTATDKGWRWHEKHWKPHD